MAGGIFLCGGQIIRPTTLQRLEQRAKEDENTLEDVIKRLLNETAVDVPLEEVITEVMTQYNEVGCVYVNHVPSHEDPNLLQVTVFTSEANSLEDTVDAFNTGNRILVESNGTTKQLRLPFSVIATFDSPKTMNNAAGTPVYLAEQIKGSDPVDMDTGLNYLRGKLGNPEWEEPRNPLEGIPGSPE